jgi:hypothetical protein
VFQDLALHEGTSQLQTASASFWTVLINNFFFLRILFLSESNLVPCFYQRINVVFVSFQFLYILCSLFATDYLLLASTQIKAFIIIIIIIIIGARGSA